ncbi:MAG: hypothetical protein IT458_18150 [Planctomycetes bacterium]|nr:hypothetical protein [Planctomycetota bacterium]
MPIDSEFLRILMCPRTRKPLRMATADEVRQVNERIRSGQARNYGGDTVKDPVEEGLVPEGESVVYPIQQGIPVLLVQEAIVL